MWLGDITFNVNIKFHVYQNELKRCNFCFKEDYFRSNWEMYIIKTGKNFTN